MSLDRPFEPGTVDRPIVARRDGWLVAMILLVPFVQLGISYWLSIQTVIFLIAATLMLGTIRERTPALVLAVIFSLAVCLPGLMTTDEATLEDILRVVREQTILALFLFSLPQIEHLAARRSGGVIVAMLTLMTMAIVSLELLQFLLIPFRQFPTFPYSWFVANALTLPSELSLLYSDIRASGPFGEPSYMAFVLSSVFVAMHRRFAVRPFAPIFGLLLVGIVLSRSLSGYLVALALVGAAIDRRHRSMIGATVLAAFVILVLFQSLLTDLPVLNRIFSFKGDASIYVRIVAPLIVLPTFISEYPLGAPAGLITESLAPFSIELGVLPLDLQHNGASNIIFSFGISGIFAILLLLHLSQGLVAKIYIASTLVFNGSFLAPDKFSIVVLALMCSHTMLDERRPAER